jgi:hypothetical protein
MTWHLPHERKMRQLWPSHWFSPHIFVACNTRAEAIDLCEQTARECQLQGLSPDDGWYPTVMVSSKTAAEQARFAHSRSKNELDLFHKNPDLKHPFMLALGNNGRCMAGSSRILFVVDIAIRGLNHWALKYVIDVKRSSSWSEQVQTIGRTSRLPLHLAEMRSDLRFDEFCHPRWYYPDPGDDDRSAAENAWDFILQMDTCLESSGLLSWRDLQENIDVEQTTQNSDIDANAPFTLMDRLQIDNELGALQVHGKQVTPEDVDRIVNSLPDPQSEHRIASAREHVEQVLTSRNYRTKIVQPSFDIIHPISREAPKAVDEYTIEELRDFILRDEDYDNDWADQIEIDQKIRRLIAQTKRKRDMQHYRPPMKTRQLHAADGRPGVLTDIRNSMIADLTKQGFDYRAIVGPLSQAVNVAAARMCGMTDLNCTKNDRELDRASYHYQFSIPSVKNQLKKLVLADLIMRGVVGPAQHLYVGPAGISNVS